MVEAADMTWADSALIADRIKFQDKKSNKLMLIKIKFQIHVPLMTYSQNSTSVAVTEKQ